jgi:hypothetical protein
MTKSRVYPRSLPAELRELFRLVGSDPSLAPEIRALRTVLAHALKQGDYRMALAAATPIVRLARTELITCSLPADMESVLADIGNGLIDSSRRGEPEAGEEEFEHGDTETRRSGE